MKLSLLFDRSPHHFLMKRVLIVTSSFTPAMPASVHRARQLGWCLREAGWDVEVLTPSVEFQRTEWLDDQSSVFFPTDIPCHEVPPPARSWIAKFGAKSMAWRALLPMYRQGCELLASGRFDLVYITTTVFNFFCLGRLWQRQFGVPYVLDFHDPWYRPNQSITSTNHRFKAWLSNRLARYMEAYAVKKAAGLVAVSPDYLQELRARYPAAKAFQGDRFAAIPFGVLPLDFELARPRTQVMSPASDISSPSSVPEVRSPVSEFQISAFQRFNQRPPSSDLEIAYVGVGAEIMAKSFRRIANGLARLRRQHPELLPRIRIRLFGTDGRWKDGLPKILQEQAVAAGIGDLVAEDPRIIPYRQAIERAVAADGLLVLGVDDPAYMPSKLFLYAMTGKPLLACMHAGSQVNDYFKRFPELGTLIHFDGPAETEAAEDARLLEFLKQVAEHKSFPRENVRREFSAVAMARKHAELFDKIVASGERGGASREQVAARSSRLAARS